MITSSIYNNASSHNFKHFDINKYFKARLYRLYPPLLFSLIIMMVVYFFSVAFNISLSQGDEVYLAINKFEVDLNILASAFFLHNILEGHLTTPTLNSPLWSLSHEFLFYICGAFLALSYIKKNLTGLLLVLFIGIVIYLYGQRLVLFGGFSVWLSGAILLVAHQNDLFKTRYIRIFCLCLSVIFTICWYFAFSSDLIHWALSAKYIWGLSFCSFLGFCLSLNSSTKEIICSNVLVQKLARSSAYSYTLYVLHWPILLLIYACVGKYYLFNPVVIISESILSIFVIVVFSKKCSQFLENKQFWASLLRHRFTVNF